MKPVRSYRDKLQRAFRVDGGSQQPGSDRDAGADPADPLRRALQRHETRRRRSLPAIALPDGEELRNPQGECYLRRLVYPLATRHGDRHLAIEPQWPRLRALAKCDEFEVELEDCLFLDTETTGLAGGSGTVVFLCGMGYFAGEDFVLEQVFLRGFSEEAAAMHHVAQRLREHPCLVTFVGKSFDRHRIAARMAVCKIESAVLTDQHLDLYHLARRVWGKQLPNVKLRTVEERRLGVFRDGDLPGSEAPYAFLAWLRDRTGRVDLVMEHNRMDVLSLVTLLQAISDSTDE